MGLFDFLFGKQNKNVNLITLQRQLEILNDCAELIEKTVNPETFFDRYDLYIEKLTLLANAEMSGAKGVKFSGESFVQKLSKANTKQEWISVVNNFIDRMWVDTCEKAANLKTDNGRQNRYQKFYDTLQAYENRMPIECIQYYRSLNFDSAVSLPSKNRNSISASQIDSMQRMEASPLYRKKVYKKYYSDYPEMPFISQDRELNTNWLNQAEKFGSNVVEKRMMTRYPDGLLPGHIYMLYWLGKSNRKRIPSYFEYRYGINFEKEKKFLIEEGYLTADNKPTPKGNDTIAQHIDIINERHPTPKNSGSPSFAIPKQVNIKRTIPDSPTKGKVHIANSDLPLLDSEFSYVNKVIHYACGLAGISENLLIDIKRFSYRFDTWETYYEWTPFTQSGKSAKYPLVLHYAYASNNLPPNECFGELQYLQNGAIGKARLIFWCEKIGYFIYLGQTKNNLVIKKVIKSTPPEQIILYKE